MESTPPRAGDASLACLLAYSEYMRERFAMAILEMPAADFTAPLGLGWMFGSIRDLFAHLIEVEEGWVRGVIQGQDRPSPPPEAFLDAASIVRRWEEVRACTREQLARSDQAEFARTIRAPFHGEPRLSVRQIYMHLLIHEVHHRGQITAAMRMRGLAPPPSDFYDYIAEALQGAPGGGP